MEKFKNKILKNFNSIIQERKKAKKNITLKQNKKEKRK